MDQYLVRVDYCCPDIKTGGAWVVLRGDKPSVGELRHDLLPSSGCKTYLYRQSCDDTDCNQQEVLEVRAFSEEEARRLNAFYPSGLAARCLA